MKERFLKRPHCFVSLAVLLAMLLFTPAGRGLAQGTMVVIDPSSSEVAVGATTTVDIRIDAISDLFGAEVHMEFDPAVVGDLVLMKSDGTPTYNFACVIDDSEMGVTHIIRGDDHLSNTPKQLVVYHALSLPPPVITAVCSFSALTIWRSNPPQLFFTSCLLPLTVPASYRQWRRP